MRIATWNINGVKARLETAATWLADAKPDIVCLQETKSTDDAFPRAPFEDLGYNLALHGQKNFNGVALLSKLPIEDVSIRLPGDDGDAEARFIEAVFSAGGSAIRVASLYLPNGNPPHGDRFDYKLAWFDRLHEWARQRLLTEEPFVLAGDYNVIPSPLDARFPDNWTRDALYQPEAQAAWRRLLALGLTDAVRTAAPLSGVYTFWDYQAGAWQKNNGIRIDHVVLSPQAADRMVGVTIDRRPRGWDKPSDHVPVIVEIAM